MGNKIEDNENVDNDTSLNKVTETTHSSFNVDIAAVNLFTKGIGINDIAESLGIPHNHVLAILNNYADQAPLIAILQSAKNQLSYAKILHSIAKDRNNDVADRIQAAKAGVASYSELVKTWRSSHSYSKINDINSQKAHLSIWDTFQNDGDSEDT